MEEEKETKELQLLDFSLSLDRYATFEQAAPAASAGQATAATALHGGAISEKPLTFRQDANRTKLTTRQLIKHLSQLQRQLLLLLPQLPPLISHQQHQQPSHNQHHQQRHQPSWLVRALSLVPVVGQLLVKPPQKAFSLLHEYYEYLEVFLGHCKYPPLPSSNDDDDVGYYIMNMSLAPSTTNPVSSSSTSSATTSSSSSINNSHKPSPPTVSQQHHQATQFRLKKRVATLIEEIRIVQQLIIVLLREYKRQLNLADISDNYSVPTTSHNYTTISQVLLGGIGHAYRQLLEYLTMAEQNAQCAHWSYLPKLAISPIALDASHSTLHSILRHGVDLRFDQRMMHWKGKEHAPGYRMMKFFSDMVDPTEHMETVSIELKKYDDHPSGALGKIHSTRVNLSKRELRWGSPVNREQSDGMLSATYPWINPEKWNISKDAANKLVSDSQLCPDTNSSNLTLLNDPNADGYVLVRGEGFVMGATADGSGAGAHARYAANIFLACLLYKLVGEPSQYDPYNVVDDDKPSSHAKTRRPLEFSSTHDLMRFLQEVIMFAQQVLVDTDEAGGTTLVAYAMTELDAAQADWIFKKSPSTFSWYRNEPTPDPKRRMMALNYVIAGDAEGFWYNAAKKKWKSIEQRPLDTDAIRLNTSYTPGGIGRHHGTRDRLWGAYLWPDYMYRDPPDARRASRVRKSKSSRSLQNLTDDSTNTFDYPAPNCPNLMITQSPSVMHDFHSHSNNIHFGQVILAPEDVLVFTTDGLGDTLDPVQLYPRPGVIAGLEWVGMSSWQAVAGRCGSAVVARRLKEMALQRALEPIFNPYEHVPSPVEEELGSPSTPLQPKTKPDPVGSVSAAAILKQCVQHAMQATQASRDMYDDNDFFYANRFDKQQMMEKRIDAFMNRHFAPQLMRLSAGANIQLSSSGAGSLVSKLGLPGIFVPFAKVDHLGIQVLSASSVSRSSPVRPSTTSTSPSSADGDGPDATHKLSG